VEGVRVEQILVPDLGDIEAVDVVEVLVTAGDRVAKEDPLITLESEKASMDVPSPLAGKIVDIKVKTGDQVAAGDLILTLEVTEAAVGEGLVPSRAGTSPAPTPSREPKPPASRDVGEGLVPSQEETKRQASAPPKAESPPAQSPPIDNATFTHAYASPAIRRYARELGVDLPRVQGSGRKGRILREDVQAFVKKALATGAPTAAGASALPPMPVIDFSKFGPIERVPLSRIQKFSVTNLHRSWLHVPHVTQHDEADITDLEAFRKSNADKAKARGFKLTPLAFIMKAAVAALEEFPRLNSSLAPDGESVILKGYYHLGVAVDTQDGLVVPVIRDVDKKGVFELAQELGEVSARAREGKLALDEIRGASFTITSLGGIGGSAFTPIVNAPEVAILGVSRSQQKPVWDGRKFVPRLTLPISLSYDHRVVDGAMAVRFTTYLCSVLADLRKMVL
jgi:pyruvate dehydrogenase E2 component (dihydrolipoamide acetyltransferase)